jgi:hypothetical protein
MSVVRIEQRILAAPIIVVLDDPADFSVLDHRRKPGRGVCRDDDLVSTCSKKWARKPIIAYYINIRPGKLDSSASNRICQKRVIRGSPFVGMTKLVFELICPRSQCSCALIVNAYAPSDISVQTLDFKIIRLPALLDFGR